MEKTVAKFQTFKEAEEAEIIQQISLTPEERQKIAKALKIRVYGENPSDIRESQNKNEK